MVYNKFIIIKLHKYAQSIVFIKIKIKKKKLKANLTYKM